MEQRLQKALAEAGVASRRQSEVLITEGRITVNGQVITQLGTKVDDTTAEICVDGKPVQKVTRKVYIMLHKPVGYTSTCSDRHAAQTVLDLVGDVGVRVYPVGRLDKDTSGLLLLTNDGDFTKLMTHPGHGMSKTYEATVRGKFPGASLDRLRKGVKLDDGVTGRAAAKMLDYSRKTDTTKVRLTIFEGRNRQVRRMFETVGHPVLELARVAVGDLELGELEEGKSRKLTREEVSRLRKMASQK